MKIKEKIAEALGMPSISDDEIKDIVLKSASVTEREKQIILLRLSGETLKVVGDQFNITGNRIRQVENRAIFKIRRELKSLTPPEEEKDIAACSIEEIRSMDIGVLNLPHKCYYAFERRLGDIGELVDVVASNKNWNKDFYCIGAKTKNIVEETLKNLGFKI